MRHFVAMLMLTTSAALFSQEDCDLFNIQELSAAYLNFSVDTVILQFDGSYEIQLSNGTTASITFGCTDSDYLEYNAAANTDDGSCSTAVVEGCTDTAYLEYNAAANTDDGSCSTAVVEGCTDTAYLEYNASANTDDGSCSTAVVEGCTDTAYLEYNAAANTDDGSCSTAVVEGCTDPADVNYDAAANTDDGSCGSTCTDVEMNGHTYAVVEIGDQCWFAENLRTTVYGNGDVIPAGLNDGEWGSTTAGATAVYGEGSSGCDNYSPDPNACDEAQSLAAYGRLYNWYAVDDARGLCPAGWHVPTDGEWTELEAYITSQGFAGTEGTALKSTTGWSNNGNGTDNFGFSALPGGFRHFYYGYFANAGGAGNWWSSSPSGGAAFLSWELEVAADDPRYGFSVRCLRDAEVSEVQGCTDPAYIEYDTTATADDGSCLTLVVFGCTDAAYTEYNAAANTDDGSCATLTSTCTDVEMNGHTYAVVEIGDQCWFAENLRTTVYGNGDVIPAGLTNGEWGSTTAGATAVYGEGSIYCGNYSPVIDACDEAQSLAAYGRLYNWYAVDDARGLCPAGWHVPTDGEWTELEDYITSQGFAGTEGLALKSTTGWSNNGNGTNDFGFSALPGGLRLDYGYFSLAGNVGYWWSSSPSVGNAWYRSLGNDDPDIGRSSFNPRNGFSVRCLRDAD